MKIIIVYTHNWKQLCEQYEDHSLYHVNICVMKKIFALPLGTTDKQ